MVFVAGLLVSCGSSEPPLVGTIQSSAGTTIQTGETTSLNVEASGSDLQFEWTAISGSLSDPSQPAVIYTAPNSAGSDTVTVVVSSGGALR